MASIASSEVPGRPPMHRRLRALARLTRRDIGLVVLLVRVYVLLIAARAVITAFSLERITRHLGTPMTETPDDGISVDQLRYARRVEWAVRHAAPRTPTNSNCYPQALAAWWVLHRKRVPTTVYYGAAFDDSGDELQAHVWLRSGPIVVTGGGVSRRFAPLTWYSDTASARSSPRRRVQQDPT